ncbi:MAG: hypothetical protein H7067_04455, partial [Burkholderiales bacterium]|nr:hypothetical protein [Opitutaceae bacterium]
MISQIASLLPRGLHPRTLLRRRLERTTRAGLVLGGPFVGMRYVGQSVGSMWWPKILGTYEIELADVIRDLCLARPPWVVDIGAAEGYYAIGFAWRCPETRVIAFEGEPAGRKLQAELAELNGVAARVRIEGFCDHAELNRALSFATGGLIICDIEGGEKDLLDPVLVPALGDHRWSLLIEIHDHVDPTIMNTLIDRFYATHTVEEIVTRPRRARDLPASARSSFLARWIPAFLDERRPAPMRWLLLRPNA